jgi:xanthine dehydrogenase accessory factor
MMHRWQQAISQCHDQGDAFVIVTVIGVSGSTPREGGSKMIVTQTDTFDTIGGGQLEFLTTQRARELIVKGVLAQKLEHYPLSSKVGQCCGGAVNMLYEIFPAAAHQVAIFGAGHVAQAVVKILSECDCRISWVDSRPEIFPLQLAPNVSKQCLQTPEEFLDRLTPNADVLILTHDHALDYRLLLELLLHTDIESIGLIGSATKAKRFRQRLIHDGVSEQALSRYVCPVGDTAIKGKLPMEVAVSICAQILAKSQTASSKDNPRRGVSWREIKSVLNGDVSASRSVAADPVSRSSKQE